MVWNEITELEEWEAILEKSVDKDQVILKHSTTCPVSFNALDEYNDYLADTPDTNIDYSLVKVRESRPVSNQIEADLEVKHESPQIIYIKNKKAYWNTSHWSVTKAHMKAVID
ncbi:MAG TPA: bacillithiol system redox-active protein YtxJ [Candidatus Pseudogracilibacillus intestinigallinarum]|uniref:Bacillithiol system redox-active protein YtxJ n=1 Tax=Candidatus Pseudogracilibacillus intestinigallinarum TaxID=2838742 RepID=A0A9D1TKE2_9BACI|nr:bacillithiol system redox-active protein YtxJ [Candidatus Pseudogracilibacillus intestinigallinarum]